MNQTTALVRVVKDAEVRIIKADNAVLNISAVHSDKYKGADGEMKDASTWYEIVKWGKPDFLNKVVQYYKKGAVLLVSGKVSARPYLASDGTAKASLVITVNTIDIAKFADEKKNEASVGHQGQESVGHNFQPVPEGFNGSGNNEEQDDLPF